LRIKTEHLAPASSDLGHRPGDEDGLEVALGDVDVGEGLAVQRDVDRTGFNLFLEAVFVLAPRHSGYRKTMFLVLDQVFYRGFKSNTHNNYNYIIKTKWNYSN